MGLCEYVRATGALYIIIFCFPCKLTVSTKTFHVIAEQPAHEKMETNHDQDISLGLQSLHTDSQSEWEHTAGS